MGKLWFNSTFGVPTEAETRPAKGFWQDQSIFILGCLASGRQGPRLRFMALWSWVIFQAHEWDSYNLLKYLGSLLKHKHVQQKVLAGFAKFLFFNVWPPGPFMFFGVSSRVKFKAPERESDDSLQHLGSLCGRDSYIWMQEYLSLLMQRYV